MEITYLFYDLVLCGESEERYVERKYLNVNADKRKAIVLGGRERLLWSGVTVDGKQLVRVSKLTTWDLC